MTRITEPPAQLPLTLDTALPEPEPPVCGYDPRELAGLPIGQFHCPWCGLMCLAGMEHPPRDDWATLEAFIAGAR